MASLKAAAEDKTNPNVSKVTSFAVDPRILEVREGFNARPLNQEHVEQMAVSYANGATFPPLDVEVEDGHIYPVDGHHRRAAALLAISRGAPIRSVECRQFRGNDADKVAHLITSASGLPLTPLQLGVQYRKLIGFGWTEKQIADRVGKSGQHVKDMILLAEANSDVHKAVTAGEVTGTTAVALVKKHGSKAGQVIREVVEQAKASGKTKATPKMFAQPSDDQVGNKLTVEWIAVNTKLPDADTTVLIALSEGEVWLGYLDGETWRYADAMPIALEAVTHWMHVPAVPNATTTKEKASA
jgi:ParB-like chromosome segregation protein Spo0J